MFSLDYFDSRGLRDPAGLPRLSLIPVLHLSLTEFLNRTFAGENAKNRAFFGGKK
jgi:hypothetical protein